MSPIKWQKCQLILYLHLINKPNNDSEILSISSAQSIWRDMDPEDSTIALPDLIGWIGGQPIAIDNGIKLSIGFIGFRGFNDLKIVEDAVQKVLENQ